MSRGEVHKFSLRWGGSQKFVGAPVLVPSLMALFLRKIPRRRAVLRLERC